MLRTGWCEAAVTNRSMWRLNRDGYEMNISDSHTAPRPGVSHRAGLIFVLGVLGLLGVVACAPVAWWMGTVDLSRMEHGRMDAAGKGLTNLGRFLGMAVTTLVVFLLLMAIVFRLVA